MNRKQFVAMSKDIKENPSKLQEYRKAFRNVYPFSDGIFKILMANKNKPQRTINFLNAMLDLTGDNAIKTFTLQVQEFPGVLYEKTVIFDVFGTTQKGDPVLIEVQQVANQLFEDRMVYYTSRIISECKKKGEDFNLPHVYILSLMIEEQFPLERDTWFHSTHLVRNSKHKYAKLDIYNIEVEKFFALDEQSKILDTSPRAKTLRIFRDVLEDKEIPLENLKDLLDEDFAKDVSLSKFTDKLLLKEADIMTDIQYEREGAYLKGHKEGLVEGRAEGLTEGKRQMAKALLNQNVSVTAIAAASGLTVEEIQAL